MKQIVLTGIREMQTIEVPKPVVQRDTDLLLRIEAVGVCGSDIHYYTRGRIGDQLVSYPYAVGHECAATVEAVGSAVKDLQVGDRVAVDPAVWCGQCDQCLRGRFHTCRNLVFMGCPGQIPGCLSEYYVMPAASCHKVSRNLDAGGIAVVEPLSIGVYALRLAQLAPESSILIQGLGPIGLSVLTAARWQGIRSICATEPLAYRRRVAEQRGIDHIWDPHRDDTLRAAAVVTSGGFDAVFECCGQQEALDEACQLLVPGGKLLAIGIPDVDRVSFDASMLRRHEICVQSVRRQNECVPDAIKIMEQPEFDASFMITHQFDFDRCQEAFDLVADYADGVVKAIVTMD